MCGSSDDQQNIQKEQEGLSNLMLEDFRQRFATQDAEMKELSSQLALEYSEGARNVGLTPIERSSRETAIINATGGNYASAKQALQTTLSARGGGNAPGVTSGAEGQLQAVLAGQAAMFKSGEEIKTEDINAQLAREKMQRAQAGQEFLIQAQSPGSYGQMAQSGFGESFKEATTIQQMENQKEAAIASGITSLAMDAATGGAAAVAGAPGGFLGGFTGTTQALG